MLRRPFYLLSVLMVVGVAVGMYYDLRAAWAFVVVGPLLLIGYWDVFQRKQALRRNYPVVGRLRYLLESFRPEIQQYFVETNVDGRPFNRDFRSIVYQRAKGALQTHPFGTQHDTDDLGYEWLSHSLRPAEHLDAEPRVTIGKTRCDKPYEASHFNISAMSYGSLSKNAILSLSNGAREGGFFHNTGEGGVSPYHLQGGGDLVWQIGTGYFGCRTDDGRFNPDRFQETSQLANVKMIEVKVSQGAKPAHGGILPAAKVTPEIAKIRGVPLHKDVLSPPGHREFSTPIELLEFITKLRELSGGKPVGFKMCLGKRHEFMAICKAMLDTGLRPDFITVDGGEGGTGAAPLEFANSVGTPLREGLLFVHNSLVGSGLRDDVKLIATGKIVTGFHLVRAIALGADICASARGMMFALGCIQARRCNDNACPVGVATTNIKLGFALEVSNKTKRVASFHRETIKAFLELVGAAGLKHPREVSPEQIHRRIEINKVSDYGQLYDYVDKGSLIDGSAPPNLLKPWRRAAANQF